MLVSITQYLPVPTTPNFCRGRGWGARVPDFPNEPIYCKVDKHLYEGPNIRQWVKKHSVSPLTRETVLESDLVSVDPLKAVLPVLEVREERRE